MNAIKILVLMTMAFIAETSPSFANLVVQMLPSKTVGAKTVIQLKVKNTFTQKIESAGMRIIWNTAYKSRQDYHFRRRRTAYIPQ